MKLLLFLIAILVFLKSHCQFLTENIQFVNKLDDIRKARIMGLDIYAYSLNGNKIIDSVLVQQNGYDSAGNAIYLNNGKTVTTLIYSNGKLSGATQENKVSKYMLAYEFKYDSLGRLFEEYTYNPNNQHLLVYRYEYYENKVKTIYDKLDKEDYKVWKLFSYKGDKVDTLKEMKDGKLYSTVVYEYNEGAKTITRYQLYKKQKIKEADQFLDEKGRLIHETIYENARPENGGGNLSTNWFYKLNDDNLRIESRSIYQKEMKSLYRYIYFTRD